MKPGRNWAFLTECDNLSPVSSDTLEKLIKMNACFYEHIVISDTPCLSNWKLYDIASRDRRWIDSKLLVVALRDQFSSLVALHRYSLNEKLHALNPDPAIAEFFDKAQTVDIDFSHLSTHYTNRVDELLQDPRLLNDFGISESLRARLIDTTVKEFDQKGFVTRVSIFNLAESLPEPERTIIRRCGTAYYWEGVPAVLGTTASVHRAEAAFDTDLLDESLRNSPVSTTSIESDEIEVLEDCRALDVKDILLIRTLPTFDALNCAIRDLPENPEEKQVEHIRRKYLNHLDMLRTYIGVGTGLRFRRFAIKTWIDVYPRLRYYGAASFVLGIAAAVFPPAAIVAAPVTVGGLMMGGLLTGASFLKSPEQILDKAGHEYARRVLRSSSNQKEKQFRVSSVSGNISHKAEQSNEKGAS